VVGLHLDLGAALRTGLNLNLWSLDLDLDLGCLDLDLGCLDLNFQLSLWYFDIHGFTTEDDLVVGRIVDGLVLAAGKLGDAHRACHAGHVAETADLAAHRLAHTTAAVDVAGEVATSETAALERTEVWHADVAAQLECAAVSHALWVALHARLAVVALGAAGVAIEIAQFAERLAEAALATEVDSAIKRARIGVHAAAQEAAFPTAFRRWWAVVELTSQP